MSGPRLQPGNNGRLPPFPPCCLVHRTTEGPAAVCSSTPSHGRHQLLMFHSTHLRLLRAALVDDLQGHTHNGARGGLAGIAALLAGHLRDLVLLVLLPASREKATAAWGGAALDWLLVAAAVYQTWGVLACRLHRGHTARELLLRCCSAASIPGAQEWQGLPDAAPVLLPAGDLASRPSHCTDRPPCLIPQPRLFLLPVFCTWVLLHVMQPNQTAVPTACCTVMLRPTAILHRTPWMLLKTGCCPRQPADP